jgi:hypothetical protein
MRKIADKTVKIGVKRHFFWNFLENWQRRHRKFSGSKAYWENRYADGGNSGAGSYNRLADFKAENNLFSIHSVNYGR